MSRKSDEGQRIEGRVVDEREGRGVTGLRVEAWDKDLIFNDLLGSAVTDADGQFRIEFDESYYREGFFDRAPDLFFKVFDDGELLASTENSVLWNTRTAPSPVHISVPWKGEPAPLAVAVEYFVAGIVSSPDRAGVGGLRVRVVDRNVGQDVTLAETLTDARGRYQVSFDPSAALGARKQRPDLQARVYSGQSFLAASAVVYDASGRETLNVTLPPNSATLPSEYETLVATLAEHYKGALADLKETDERPDITYLANKTGWDARAVALAALAEQLARQGADGENAASIEPAFYYALLRAGLPADPEALYRAGAQTVVTVWRRAVEKGVIPAALGKEIDGAAEAFRRVQARKFLSGSALAGASALREMLAVSQLDDARQQRFAELYAEHRDEPEQFWQAIEGEFGGQAARRLQLDGKLGFLTINNAPLVSALHEEAGREGLTDTSELAPRGYYRASQWAGLLGDSVPVPPEIPGGTKEERRDNYAQYLAARVRLSYPTASVADMVKSGDLKVNAPDEVHAFLLEHGGKFEIGMQPVEQYAARNNLRVPVETVREVKRLQRVYQITPSDEAMGGLLRRGLDAAAHVVRYEKRAFVEKYAGDLGGEAAATQTYERATQVHNAVLNVVVSYLTNMNGVALGTHKFKSQPPGGSGQNGGGQNSGGQGQLIQPGAQGPSGGSPDVIAYPTLEGLFGELDFCACEECRSILSPAAYLVDLLTFIDQEPAQPGTQNPQEVFFTRRPDVQHLPLTCENTNTALPYIDVVNETLEYFVANATLDPPVLSMDGYVGQDTGTAASEDLLASPQFVADKVYDDTLRAARFPAPLPFHLHLEKLRRYFEQLEVPLPLAMERLRKGDALDVAPQADPTDYAWRDILIEELKLSREEYALLTDSAAAPLASLYGFAEGTTPEAAIAELSNAENYSRRVNVTYEELVEILVTRFVNPNSDLVPKLERLGVPFAALKKLKETNTPAADAEFDALLPQGAGAPDPEDYDGDIKAWVRRQENYDRIMDIITLADPTGGGDDCDFGKLEFRLSLPVSSPADTSTRISEADFMRLLRFIRLWRKLGWTVEQVDAALCALFPVPPFPAAADALKTDAGLDAGFRDALPRLGVVVRVMRALGLNPQRDLMPLLACWSPLGTHGASSLYRQMFLNPALLAQDAAFADNGYGEFLKDGAQSLLAHAEALRSAFNLTGEEFQLIADALAFDANTLLSLDAVSAVFRRGWLARKLKLSVREFLLLTRLTGLDPFAAPDPTAPAILRLVELVQALRERSLKPSAALYLIWHQDLSGRSTPTDTQVASFARSLRLGLSAVESEFAVKDDPDGTLAQTRMTLVYGSEASAFFFGLVNDTLTVETGFGDPGGLFADDARRQAVEAAAGQTVAGAPRIAFDDFRKQLAFTGVMTQTRADAIKAADADAPFQAAVDSLLELNQSAVNPFFARYPELQPLYDAYAASNDTAAAKRAALLGQLLPELIKRRKGQQALQAVSAAAQTTLDFARALLDATDAGSALHAASSADRPALDDFLALETGGLSVSFYASDTASGPTMLSPEVADDLDYAPTVGGAGNPLPPNPSTPGAAISGVWRGFIEAPESGLFNIRVDADAGATVTLLLDGDAVPLALNGTLWHNTDALELRAGTLYPVVLTVEKVTERLRVEWEWEPKGQGRAVVPPRYLYPATRFEPFRRAYLRFLKAATLASALRLTANETAHFAMSADYRVGAQGQPDPNGDGWLNVLPVADNLNLSDPAEAAAAATLNATLVTTLRDLLDYARVKADISPDDDSLLAVLKDPAASAAGDDAPLYALTRWTPSSLGALLAHFGAGTADLSHFALFRRVYDAFAVIQTMGVSAQALVGATTNEPDGDAVRDLEAALRALYDAADWRTVVQPINDALRALRRDALVAYVLHRMRESGDDNLKAIDTADKLFEYFLMDVQMEPCMQTSRIRHALSSVQLFVERCLMNLEPDVSAGSLSAERWEWMKRYRVWEANRKVFLFPENWLEPELRDDKSPFFKEIESELLQSDITEERAAVALLNYLAKLEEVAKLEPCGLFHAPADAQKKTNEVDHVIAHTAGAHRKYFYRRFDAGSWSPWELIKLDIEDDPVVPFVWDDRLLLFWLRLVKQTPLSLPANPTGPPPKQGGNSEPTLNQLTLSDVKKDAKTGADENLKVSVSAILCWSEYYNGKWQAAKTSDINNPAPLGQYATTGAGAFSRSDLRLVAGEEDDALRVSVISGGGAASFTLYNTHSLPVPGAYVSPAAPFGQSRGIISVLDPFRIVYMNVVPDLPLQLFGRDVLEPPLPPRVVEACDFTSDAWNAPFFYEDSRNVFFVTTEEQQVRIYDHPGYGIDTSSGKDKVADIPPLVWQVVDVPGPKYWGDGGPVDAGLGVINPDPVQRFVTEDAYIVRGIGSAGAVRYGDSLIGPGGAIADVKGTTKGGING